MRRADQVLLMDVGRLVARGTLDELLTRSAEMQRLWQDDQHPLESPSSATTDQVADDVDLEEWTWEESNTKRRVFKTCLRGLAPR